MANKLFAAMYHYTRDLENSRYPKIKGLDVYGKTGTAQNPHGQDHGWFLAFAGREGQKPELAVAVFVEFGKSGSSVAGPVARKMIEAYFKAQDETDTSTEPLGE